MAFRHSQNHYKEPIYPVPAEYIFYHNLVKETSVQQPQEGNKEDICAKIK